MNRTALSLVALPAIAAAAILLADPTQALAQHGGGHGGGGFHSGGGFHGGAVGGYHGGAVGGYHGGFNRGDFAGGYRSYGGYSGYHPYGYHPYYGDSHYPYYSGYGYPYYGAYYPNYGSTLTYGSSDWTLSPVDSGYAAPPLPATPNAPAASAGIAPVGGLEESSPAPVALADSPADVTVSVPADAELWFDETKTTSTGPVRLFHSPPLTPGRNYTYEIRAQWKEGGHNVTQTQTVGVTAGANLAVRFPLTAGGPGRTTPVH